MFGKGSNTTTSTQTPDPRAMQAYQDLLRRAGQISRTPYEAYGGELTAGINEQQQRGISGINQYAGFALPYIQQAGEYAKQAAQPISAADIQRYQSPYTQQVVDAMQKQFANTNAQQQSSVLGNAAAQGALGGDRSAVAQANLAGQQQAQEAPVIAGLYNTGYQNASQMALAQQQAMAQGAYSLGNLGVAGQNAALQGAGAQFGAGTAEQQTQQQRDMALYQQFMQRQAFPYQQLQWLAGLDTGVGSQMGGTSTTTGPPPNPWAQWMGLGMAGAGMFGPSSGHARGGKVAGFAPGGMVAPWPGGGGGVSGPGTLMDGPSGGQLGNPQGPGIAGGYGPLTPLQGGLGNPQGPGSYGPMAGFGQRFNQWMDNHPQWQNRHPGFASWGNGLMSGFGRSSMPGGVSGPGGTMDGTSTQMPGGGAGAAGPGGMVDGNPMQMPGGGVSGPGAMLDGNSISASGAISGPSANFSADAPGRVGATAPGGIGAPPAVSANQTSDMRPHYDDGGGVAGFGGMPWGGAGGWIPNAQITHGSGPPKPPGAPGHDKPADTAGAAKGLSSAMSGLGSLGSSALSGLGEAMPETMASVAEFLPFLALKRGGRAGFAPGGDVSPFDDFDADYPGAPGLTRKALLADAGRRHAGEPALYAEDDSVPLPRARPEEADAVAPETAEPSLGRQNLRSAPEVNPETARSGFGGFGLSDAARTGLMAAGLGMMASRSPNLGQAIGEGGLQGISAYSSVETARKKLEAHADEVAKKLKAESAKEARLQEAQDATADYRERMLEQGKMPPGMRMVNGKLEESPGYTDTLQKIEKAKTEGKGTTLEPATLNGAAEQYLKTGTFPPQVGRGNTPQAVADRNAIMNHAYQLAGERGIDPEGLPKRWQKFRSEQTNITRFMSGPQGNSIRSLNVATDHLQTLSTLGEALKNSNYPLFNELAQRWSQMTGSAVPTNFDTAKQIIGTEVIKAIGVAGAGTKDEREAMSSRFARASSPEQLQGAINETIKPLLIGQLRGLRHQFMQATGLDSAGFDDLLMPSTRSWMGSGSPEPGRATPANAAPAAPVGGGAKPDPAVRFRQLTEGGMSKADAYAKMHAEGY